MGDASRAGFGSAFWDNAHLHYQAGIHSLTLAQESSNFWEVNNLVSWLEELEQEGRLEGSEVFMITDNPPLKGYFVRAALRLESLITSF